MVKSLTGKSQQGQVNKEKGENLEFMSSFVEGWKRLNIFSCFLIVCQYCSSKDIGNIMSLSVKDPLVDL